MIVPSPRFAFGSDAAATLSIFSRLLALFTLRIDYLLSKMY